MKFHARPDHQPHSKPTKTQNKTNETKQTKGSPRCKSKPHDAAHMQHVAEFPPTRTRSNKQTNNHGYEHSSSRRLRRGRKWGATSVESFNAVNRPDKALRFGIRLGDGTSSCAALSAVVRTAPARKLVVSSRASCSPTSASRSVRSMPTAVDPNEPSSRML